jgi:hypothetical protein
MSAERGLGASTSAGGPRTGGSRSGNREDARLFTGHRTESMFNRYNIDDDLQLRDAVDRLTAYMATQTPRRR